MTYPIVTTGSLQPEGTLDLTFRPSTAGIVNVTLVCFGTPPPPPAGTPPVQPKPYTMRLHLDIFKPGSTTPVSSVRTLRVNPGGSNRIVMWLDIPAAAADLAANWIARVSNFSDGQAACRCTARYQTLPGNLGKIDHVVVLMMENRSFDHMLGYLQLEGKRPDVVGLTGSEVNHDSNGVAVQVHPLATDGRTRPTYFANDPGHVWDDVGEQLGPDPVTAGSNGGFVVNFTKQLAAQAQNLPPLWTTVHDQALIDSADSRFVQFRPVLPGRITLHSTLSPVPGKSSNNLLAQLILRRPGSSAQVATVKAPPGTPALGLSFDVSAADLTIPGNWTCEVLNWADQALTFSTDVGFMLALHDTRGQEPAAAIMGYYDATQLPAYDLLASEFLICNKWFSSLPTDTWPNRLYALTGGSGHVINTPSGDDVRRHPPGYTLKTVFEVLEEHTVDWKIFFSDLPFPLVFKPLAQDARYTARMNSLGGFVAAAQTGDLPAVSWLEPNFTDVEQAIARPNAADDDHPPGDVALGQQLVQQIFSAASAGPGWSKTLLLITYDEHGGFYDHVRPRGTPPIHDPTDVVPDQFDDLKRYGPRVPAFVVSPWVPRRSVSNTEFDHTSIVATILRRFCGTPVPSMGLRADAAADVGPLLTATSPRRPVPMPPVSVPPPPTGSALPTPDGFGLVLRKTLLGL